jgi:hypothetical protein
VQVIEELARADASVAWTVMIGSEGPVLFRMLPSAETSTPGQVTGPTPVSAQGPSPSDDEPGPVTATSPGSLPGRRTNSTAPARQASDAAVVVAILVRRRRRRTSSARRTSAVCVEWLDRRQTGAEPVGDLRHHASTSIGGWSSVRSLGCRSRQDRSASASSPPVFGTPDGRTMPRRGLRDGTNSHRRLTSG